MKKLTRWFAMGLLLIGLAGCSRGVAVSTIYGTVSAGHSATQVHNAILLAGKQRKWVMNDAQPGVITGRVTERSHVAEIRIPYTASGYSIEYVNSENLRAKNGEIHRNYVRWVRNLDKQIQLNLSASPE